ncbi:hypothetical protein ACFWZ2_42705 [Streptomyces sp. NPDC059002]|uniref:hypothetical protein n=1 Tax=Streptomyces sp. NPDC059002 TaxID=3346690 RepID=UPI00369AE6E5
MKARYPIGTLVVDEEKGKPGRVMGHEGPYIQLRPPGGGREWDADPSRVRPADEAERLRASVVEVALTSDRHRNADPAPP